MRKELDKLIQISMMTSIVVVLEKALESIPNVQLTVVLLMAFIYFLSLPEALLLATAYTLLDILLGGVSLYAIPMIIAWNFFAFIVYLAKGKLKTLLIIGFIYPIFYSVLLGLPYIYSLNLDIRAYFIADIPFTLVFMIANVLTIVWLYPIITKTLASYLGDQR
jgi:hypothetical protein